MDFSSLGLENNFGLIDWAIVGIYMIGVVAIGLYVNRYVSNMADYVLAGRSLKSFIAIGTMVGTELGLVTVMYSAQKGFTGGFAAFHIPLAAGIVTLIVGLTGFIVVPLRRMGVMTIPEFYERRFSRGVRILGGLLLAGAGILNMGLFLKMGAIFVGGLTGLHDPIQINIIMTVLLGIVLVYTISGGMISVVITDYVQFVVLSVGLLIVCALAVNRLGWGSIVETVKVVHGEAGFNPFDADGFGPSYVVWMIFVAGLVSCAVWQTAVMRACAAESTKVVKRLYTVSSIGFLIRFMIPQFLGICALAFFWQSGARDTFFTGAGKVADGGQASLYAMPLFLSQILPVGLLGLIGAGMLAAFMSTHDSYLLCWASVLTQDVISPLAGQRLQTRGKLFVARLLIFVIGAFLLLWGLWYPLGQDVWDYMAVSGAIYFTGAFSVLLTGIYWKRASSVGAYLALACGVLALLGLTPVRQGLCLTEANLGFELKHEWVGLGTAGLSLALMIAGSLIFPDKRAELNQR